MSFLVYVEGFLCRPDLEGGIIKWKIIEVKQTSSRYITPSLRGGFRDTRVGGPPCWQGHLICQKQFLPSCPGGSPLSPTGLECEAVSTLAQEN